MIGAGPIGGATKRSRNTSSGYGFNGGPPKVAAEFPPAWIEAATCFPSSTLGLPPTSLEIQKLSAILAWRWRPDRRSP
jgi:hypothetical protein